MDNVMATATGILGWVSATSLQAAVLVVLVLIVQAVLKRKLTPRWSYALWFVVVARLIMPVAPASSLSVFNLLRLPEDFSTPITAPQRTELREVPNIYPEPVPTQIDSTRNSVNASSQTPVAKAIGFVRGAFTVWDGLTIAWLAGIVALGLTMAANNIALLRRVRACRPVTDPAVLNVLEDCKDRLGVTTPIAVVAVDWDRGPALFGWVRPRILIPHMLAREPETTVLRHVFMHEVAHHRRRDILANWLTSMMLLVHWFNPMLWFAFYRMRSDRELACDALALSASDANEAKAYGNTILALLDRTRTYHAVPGVVGIVEGKSGLKRRIAMIGLFKKGSYGWSLLGFAVMALLVCIGLTSASAEGDPNAKPLEKPQSAGANDSVEGPAVAKTESIQNFAKEILEREISVELEDIHLRDALSMLGENYELNFVIDPRVLRPQSDIELIVSSIRLNDVPMRGVLSAMLRPLELDYAFEEGYIWVSTPALLAHDGLKGQLGTPSSKQPFQVIQDVKPTEPPAQTPAGALRGNPNPVPKKRDIETLRAEITTLQLEQIASDQNNLKQLGIVLKMFADEVEGQRFPAIDKRAGRIIMDQALVYPEYLTQVSVLLSPWAEQPANDSADAYFDDTSYWYIPYATQEEAAGLKFVEVYREAALEGKAIELPEGVEFHGSGGAKNMLLLRKGIDRYFITDIHDPSQAAKQQAAIPVIVGRPHSWPDGRSGANVLYLDGHVEFVEYPGKYPMSEKFIGALVGLDGIENMSAAKATVSKELTTPRFQARWVVENDRAIAILAFGKNGEQMRLEPEVLISERDVATASVSPEVNVPLSYRVNVTLNDDAAERLMEATGKNVGRKLALVFDATVVSAPVVRDAVGSAVAVTGSFSKEEADALVSALTSGKSE